MKKYVISLSTAVIIGLSSLASAPANADTLNSLKNQQQQNNEKRSAVESSITQAEKQIESLQGKQVNLEEEIKKIDTTITSTNEKITAKVDEIHKTENEIKQLNQEIAILKERIKKRNELLKNRARSFQESGGNVDYLEVLFGSSDFGDFIDRVGAVATIMDADQELIKEHEQDKKDLEEKQTAVKNKLANLKNMLSDLQAMKADLTKQKAEKDRLMAQLAKKEKQIADEKMNLQEEAEILASQGSAIQKAIDLEKKHQAALQAARERAAQEAAERQKAAARAAASAAPATKHTVPKSAAVQQAPVRQSTPARAVSSSNFVKPSAGMLTSPFGYRTNPSPGFHYGVDIAQGGSVPVVSAADGVVTRAYYSDSYGNVVLVSHSINGQVFTTVYAHLNSMSVSSGQVVAQGQQVGYMGNTGQSFGQHLHFELHKGEWNAAKSNAVNPASYIPL
ncbi:peptidoglycan hydrolase CwlO-like protein [Peribacillus deserti]|uniref:Peptidoglycan hydrolase CwlO-like protein n=1 Tax=Peribacillus deserti TaxID=673318 RepID=A0ABS2QCW5_9BACI|nr:peptidoglycan DD-metalloendopeptidase family protein [Peribacillus deserti]MBM7690942.1 peptidoglycan hydrolase CwlO-like protein [Peribacillus deserti]